jgi:hypothetical protein
MGRLWAPRNSRGRADRRGQAIVDCGYTTCTGLSRGGFWVRSFDHEIDDPIPPHRSEHVEAQACLSRTTQNLARHASYAGVLGGAG